MGEDDALEVVEEDLEENLEEVPEEKPKEEFEIVLDDEGSQPDENRGVRKRVNKLNKRVEVATEGRDRAIEELTSVKHQNELLQLALDQEKTSKPPNPNDFDDGVADPKFVEANSVHIKSMIGSEVQKHAKSAPAPQTEVVNHDLVRMQTRHYEQADALKIDDFEETEDKAIDIIGRETVNQVIGASDKSHLILYYFGKNPRKAESFADLVATAPVQAAIEIGRLEEKLKVKPRTQTQQVDPDEEIQGGSASSGKRGPPGATYS